MPTVRLWLLLILRNTKHSLRNFKGISTHAKHEIRQVCSTWSIPFHKSFQILFLFLTNTRMTSWSLKFSSTPPLDQPIRKSYLKFNYLELFASRTRKWISQNYEIRTSNIFFTFYISSPSFFSSSTIISLTLFSYIPTKTIFLKSLILLNDLIKIKLIDVCNVFVATKNCISHLFLKKYFRYEKSTKNFYSLTIWIFLFIIFSQIEEFDNFNFIAGNSVWKFIFLFFSNHFVKILQSILKFV